jgi:hypothetical protein
MIQRRSQHLGSVILDGWAALAFTFCVSTQTQPSDDASVRPQCIGASYPLRHRTEDLARLRPCLPAPAC